MRVSPATEKGVRKLKVRANGSRSVTEQAAFLILRLCMLLVIMVIFYIFYDIIRKGAGVISFGFVTAMPRSGMTEGGILPAILGTVYITMITAAASFPVGVCTAIYLNEYARKNIFTRIIRLSIRNLAGVPSIVYGLFGVALFVRALAFGTSILSAGLTLGLLTLPVTITASEEALNRCPTHTARARWPWERQNGNQYVPMCCQQQYPA
jgi:phosphate transport system permease protein